jgi:CDP-glucose 4,6-dehydratase
MSQDYSLLMILDEFRSQIKASKKILITGHTGFKGIWLTLLLERLGYEVCGISLKAETGSLYQKLNRSGIIQESILDIRDRGRLKEKIDEMNPSIIFHLAAQALVLKSYNEPVETFETNVIGTANVLDAAFKSNTLEAVSVVTTDKVYANNDSGKRFKENDPLLGKDPYSASKVATESVVSGWQKIRSTSSGPLLTSFRAGNVIGGGDHAENRLLPDLVRGFIRGDKVAIRNGKSTRPWQHVLDPLTGYLMGTAHNIKNEDFTAMNFAPDGNSLSVAKVSEIACAAWGQGAEVEIQNDSSGLEALSLQLDSSLAKEKLGWYPKWSQEDAIKATVRWWLDVHQTKISPKEACDIDLDHLLK